MRDLFIEIEHVLPAGGSWCSQDKAATLASMVIAHRPAVICEIGVFLGGSLIPLALAAKWISTKLESFNTPCKVIAIDPWSAAESVIGLEGENAQWWADCPHEEIYQKFMRRVADLKLTEVVEVVRSPSDAATPPMGIGILHVDGSHTSQATRDVDRYAPNVIHGGLLVMDDLSWSGGGVQRGYEHALALGFVEMYRLGTGAVLQRRSLGA